MSSTRKRVDAGAKYSAFPASNHRGAFNSPAFVRISGMSAPAAPSIAHRPFCSSAWTYHFRLAGSAPRPRGSKPLSPGSLQWKRAGVSGDGPKDTKKESRACQELGKLSGIRKLKTPDRGPRTGSFSTKRALKRRWKRRRNRY